jgi:RNA polymerase subunit RPABC4/transcription elongation factor Spt4
MSVSILAASELVVVSSIPAGLAKVLALIISYCTAFLVLLWASLIIWTWRDARVRIPQRDWAILATVLVAVLWLPGVVLYLILRPPETAVNQYLKVFEAGMLNEYESRLRCPACHQPVRSDFLLCPCCGAQQRRPCANCSRLLLPQWRHCPYCAVPVAAREPVSAVAKRASA